MNSYVAAPQHSPHWWPHNVGFALRSRMLLFYPPLRLRSPEQQTLRGDMEIVSPSIHGPFSSWKQANSNTNLLSLKKERQETQDWHTFIVPEHCHSVCLKETLIGQSRGWPPKVWVLVKPNKRRATLASRDINSNLEWICVLLFNMTDRRSNLNAITTKYAFFKLLHTLLGLHPGDKANSETFCKWSLLAMVSVKKKTTFWLGQQWVEK